MKNKKIFVIFIILSFIVFATWFVLKEKEPIEVIESEPVVEEPLCSFGEMISEYDMCGKEIGLSVEVRPIYVFKLGDGDTKLLFVGGLHTGREINTHDLAREVLLYYKENSTLLPSNVSLYIVPALNPDGVANDTHANANDINLNRNWGASNWKTDVYHPASGNIAGGGGIAPYSEPETRALHDYILELDPDVTVVWHSKANTVEDNDIGIADTVGALYAEAAGYEHIDEWTYYEVTGDFLETMKEEEIPAFEVELETRKTELERNLKGVQATLDYFSE